MKDVVIVRGRAVDDRPDPELGTALAAAMGRKYNDYDPTPDSWDNGGMWRIDPETVLAWKAMPTSTRWRFAGEVTLTGDLGGVSLRHE